MKQRFIFSAVLCYMGILSSTAFSQNLLINGELTDPAGNNEAATGWSKSEPTLDSNSVAIDSFRFQKAGFADCADDNLSSTPNPGPDGDVNTNDLGGMWFRGFLGNNASNPNIFVDASAWQDVSAGTGQYKLNFCEKNEFYFLAAAASVQLQFYSGGGGGTLLGASSFDLLAMPGTNMNSAFIEPWFSRTLLGTAPAGTDTIRVLAQMEDGRDNPDPTVFKPQGLMLDRFELIRVPEPGACGLTLAALSALAIRRGRGTA
jgi:hypothetical protein